MSLKNMDPTTKLLHSTTDARVWAREWCRIAREGMGPEAIATLPAPVSIALDALIDEGWMIGWFANAMCVALDREHR
jgi:hypothetical protein